MEDPHGRGRQPCAFKGTGEAWISVSERERGISPRPRSAACRGDRAAPPYRARGRTASRAPARRYDQGGLSLRWRERSRPALQYVRQTQYADRLQLDVWAAARAPLP